VTRLVEDSFSCFMKTKLAALMILSGVVVHALLLLALQDEPRGSSAPAGRNEFKLNIWRHKFSFDEHVQNVSCAMRSSGATGSISLPGLKALSISFALATMASKSVASSNCTTCCAKKNLGSTGPVFGPWASAKKQSSPPP
jgi:hypothetical protein